MSLQWDCVFGILHKAQVSAKKTNNEQFGFTYRLTSGRVRSTIAVGVPTLISFVAYTEPERVRCLTRLFINEEQNRCQNTAKLAAPRCDMARG